MARPDRTIDMCRQGTSCCSRVVVVVVGCKISCLAEMKISLIVEGIRNRIGIGISVCQMNISRFGPGQVR